VQTRESRAALRTSVTLSFYLLFAAFALLIFPLHESAHYLTYRMLGIRVPMTLNTASPVDQSQRKPIAELAGPLLNLAIAGASARPDRRIYALSDWN
jgi:hypothetical protein